MRTKHLIVGQFMFAAIAMPAIAADLPSIKGPLVPAPALEYSWTGPYVGMQLGYANSYDVTKEYLTATRQFLGLQNRFKPSGFFGGIHAGYNYQFASIVAGIEADAEIADVRAGFIDPPAPPGNPGGYGSTRINFQGSLRGRLGYSFGRTLLYATGGIAAANIDNKYTNWGLVSETFTKTALGGTVGGGIEYAMTNNVTVRGEYRFTAYERYWNHSTVAFPGASGTQHLRNHTVRLGASYKF